MSSTFSPTKKHYGTGDNSSNAIRFAEANLRNAVSSSMAAVLREKPDTPMTELIKKLKAQSLEQDGIEKPHKVKIDGLEVNLVNKACKTEVMLPRNGLYGLHMPSVQNWQDVLDFIRQDNPTSATLTLIVETQDPEADLVFVNGTPYYADLTQKRLERKRKQLSSVGGGLHTTSAFKMKKSIRGGHNTSPAKAQPAQLPNAVMQALEAEVAKENETKLGTQRVTDFLIADATLRPGGGGIPMAPVEGGEVVVRGRSPTPPPLSAVKAISSSAASVVGGSRIPRRPSRVSLAPEPPAPETVCTSVLSSIPNASPRTVFQVIELITHQWETLKTTDNNTPGVVKQHLITTAATSKSPLAVFDLIDAAIGVNDDADCPPVLVVSFRSRRAIWRRLLARVYAAISPNVEWSVMQRAQSLVTEKASERDELQNQRHMLYWRRVIADRSARDLKRKEHVAALTALYKSEEEEALLDATTKSTMMGTKKMSMFSKPLLTETMIALSATGRMVKRTLSNLSETDADPFQETARSTDTTTVDLPTIMATINKAAAKRERRRQREDMHHCLIEKEERLKAAIRLQATFRGAKERITRSRGMVLESTSSVFVTPGEDLQDNDVVSASFDQKFKHAASEKIDAPAIVRRVYDKASQANPGFLTTSNPAPKAPAVRFRFWSHTKVHIHPQYDGDVSSDEEHVESKVVVVPPKSASQRRRHFNPLLRLTEVNNLTGYDDYEWGKKVAVEFKGLSVLQRKAYEVFKNHALELLHVIFLEIQHRQSGTIASSYNGVNPTMTFSEYTKTFFPDIFSWFSLTHFLSLSTAPGIASPLQYGPPSPLTDRVLYQSTSPSVLPWGRQAPLQLSDDESAWFMPHWDENAPMKVLTTVDFTSAPVWKKQLDYLTLNGRPVWWFSMCPELGIYVNNQPFIAARRPEAQCVEGFTSKDVIESVVQVPPPPALQKYPDPAPQRGQGGSKLRPEHLQSNKSSATLLSQSSASQSSRPRFVSATEHTPKPSMRTDSASLQLPILSIQEASASDKSFLLASPTADDIRHVGSYSGRRASRMSASFIKTDFDVATGQKTIFATESLTFVYPEGGNIRLRTWFGVHWTEMERRLRLQVAQDAFSNAMHVSYYAQESLLGEDLPNTSVMMGETMSEVSVVRPIGDMPSFCETVPEPDHAQALLDDSHLFKSAVCYTDSCEAPVVQSSCISMVPLPKPKPKPPRSTSPDPSVGKDGRPRSRSNSRSGPETRARSMRRLRSLVSVRNPDTANNSVTLSTTANSGMGKVRPSVSMMSAFHDETIGGANTTTMNPFQMDLTPPYASPTIDDAMRRVRTAPALAEKLFSPSVPKCRYIRCPALDVSGYQWWCNVDQYLGHVNQGLREGANIAVAITNEKHLFYSAAALLVAHANFADTDEIEEIYKMEEKRKQDILTEERRKKEALRKANYDPDDHGCKNDWLLDPSDRDLDTSLSASGISFGGDDSRGEGGLPTLGIGMSTGGGVGGASRSVMLVKSIMGSTSISVGAAEAASSRYDPTGFLNTFVQLCAKALQLDLTGILAAFNAFLASIGDEYFVQGIEADISRAERASNPKEVRKHILSAVQRSERYCNLLLVYLFLRSEPKGSENEINTIIPWLFGPKMEVAMEWLNDIDPWALTPLRSPDPNHFIYSNIYRRWTESDGFVSKAM